jgi:PPIC-type PPIASE domain
MTASVRSELPLEELPVQQKRLLYHLSRSQLLVKYLRGILIEETLENWENSPAFELVRDRLVVNDPNDRQGAIFQLYKQTEFGNSIGTQFLARKAQLDRVLFSVIQVKDLHFAEQLYCQIEDKNQSFTRIATTHSDSPTAKRGGSIGPISMMELHPVIRHYLTGLEAKQLSPIFKLDQHYVFLKLDRILPGKITAQLEQQLIDELFERQLESQISDRIGQIQLEFVDPSIDMPQKSSPQTSTPPSSNLLQFPISQDLDLDLDPSPTGTISPTSSLFFPQWVDTSDRANGTRSSGDSSFFFPTTPPIGAITIVEKDPAPEQTLDRTLNLRIWIALFIAIATIPTIFVLSQFWIGGGNSANCFEPFCSPQFENRRK